MSKRSTILALAFLLVGVGLLASCRGRDVNSGWGWNLDRPATPMKTFSHGVHRSVFEREHMDCYACHTMAVRIGDDLDAAQAMRASESTFSAGKDACHVCHYNPQTGNTAPDRCGICHLDARTVQPANHNFDWARRHAVYAKANADSCDSCHRPRDCQDCHQRRDVTVRRVHDRNVRFTHGIEARANPMRCGQCHQARSFCQKCHIEGGYER